MLRSLIGKVGKKGPPPDPRGINHSAEHVSLAATILRRRRLTERMAQKLPVVRLAMVAVALIWLLALPYKGLWKGTYIDENAIQPSQVTMYYDWANVHKADRYLDELERIVNDTKAERTDFLQTAFAGSGLESGTTAQSTYAHVRPPRSPGTETILLTANWVSRDGDPNLRGIASLLSLGDFLNGQNHWAFDFVLVIGEGYLEGLEEFMHGYHNLFSGVVWTALNLDYPGHSFSHLGLFYEGVNGRLPNQDVLNTVVHVARYAGQVQPRIHNIDHDHFNHNEFYSRFPPFVREYLLAAKYLIAHFSYAALGRPSGAHGVLAKHRIDSLTLYCTPATGPHGFHTLGRTVESTLRSFNNLLERLHASYFFYLVPDLDHFIPVGHYLPIAILLGASITLGGFDCPAPLRGLLWMLPAYFIALVGWINQQPAVCFVALSFPKPKGDARTSLSALTHLLYGALIPTLAMVNFPQALVLAALVITSLGTNPPLRWILSIPPILAMAMALRYDWDTVGSVAWPGVFAIWLPLWIIATRL